MDTQPPTSNTFKKSILWMKSHRRLTIIVVGLVLILGASGVAYALLSQPAPKQPTVVVPPKPQPPVVYYSPLTGVKLKNEIATTQPVTAIMIENSPDARPQSGLKDAGVVFEAIAEGGITRFLTLHQEDKPKLIGPVRSLRTYFVDWLAPFNASVAHVGGSAKALKEVRKSSYRDIDQFFNPGTYWRSSDRYAPHNVYTNFKRLDALNKKKGYTTSKFTGFARADGKPVKKPTASKITINFSSALFNTSYSFDKKHNRYNRSMAGAAHNDREKGRITPRVVIALKVNEKTVMEDGYRQSIDTIGSGSAIIFQNGSATKATWTKKNRASQLVFTDKKGKEIALNRGQTWISAVPNDGGTVSWR